MTVSQHISDDGRIVMHHGESLDGDDETNLDSGPDSSCTFSACESSGDNTAFRIQLVAGDKIDLWTIEP